MFGFNSLKGGGNKRRARTYYNELERIDTDSACIAYVAVDIARFESTHDRKECSKLVNAAAKTISAFCSDSEYAAFLGVGSFVIDMSCGSILAAQQRIGKLIDDLNKSESEIFGKNVTRFHAGLYFAADGICGFDTAMHNAVLAYDRACDNDVGFYVCTNELLKNESHYNHLREKLSSAIDNNQFEMFIQFIYNVDQKQFTCAEVLSRWNNPIEGFLMPAYYINDMRKTGVIKKFDMYMLEKTCRQLSEWSDGPFKDIRLSCNITRITISMPDFIKSLHSILKKYKFDHSKLMLEITEDALIDKNIAYRNIKACKDDNILIAIDDLCAGHSTLEDISDYPMDQVKLDRQVTTGTESDRGNTLLKEVVGMAHRLGIDVVCEGVETEDQLSAVVKSGCDYVQGYYYSYVFPVGEGETYYLDSFKKKS